MNYKNPYIFRGKVGNNAFSYEERSRILGVEPSIIIPPLIEGTLEDVEIGEEIVFEEVKDGILESCRGLKHFIRLPAHHSEHITVFDNHNHALYFWLEAMREGVISAGVELIHIDEHSDLWNNANILNKEKALRNSEYAWAFTNIDCNVGNYIAPALDVGIVGNIIRIENEYQIDQYMNYIPRENTILNIDLDFFAPEMGFIPEEKKLRLIQNLLPRVKCVTIATSPYFIDQGGAIEKLKTILEYQPE